MKLLFGIGMSTLYVSFRTGDSYSVAWWVGLVGVIMVNTAVGIFYENLMKNKKEDN